MPKWKKEEPFTGTISQGCFNCDPVQQEAPMDMLIAVGFGVAEVTCDDKIVYDELSAERGEYDYWTTQDAENAALKHPNHNWRITMLEPLRGRIYQRHAPGKWVLIESDSGFA